MSANLWIAVVLISVLLSGLLLVLISVRMIMSKNGIPASNRVETLGWILVTAAGVGIILHLACTGGIDFTLLPSA